MRYSTPARTLALLLFICSVISTNAQLSEGGIPAGFKFGSHNRVPQVIMPAFNVDSMVNEDAINEKYKGRPYRFGYNHMVNYNMSNSGVWTVLPDGNRIWMLDIKSEGALTMNLAFSNFHIPAGARLFVYTKDHKQILGGFTSKNNAADKFFGTDLLNTDEVIVEYDEPYYVAGLATFTLFRVTHGYRSVNQYIKAFGDAGNCIHNVNCPQYADWYNQKRAVVCLVSGGNEFCSGALVNNTSNDGTPYVLTANHCGTADGTWVFRFNWEAPGCANPASNPPSQSISGGSPVAHNVTSDFNLVLMNSTPPASYNVFYAGWNNGTTPADSVTAIHHPSGDIKKCSRASNPVTASSYDAGNGTAQTWQIGQWTDGVTESGSSGSPLFDQNKRIIGQLYGGPSACGVSTADLTDHYGRFCVSWDTGSTPQTRLHDWLDPGNTNAVTNDGYDPNVAHFSLDASVMSIASPGAELCSNSITPSVIIRNSGRTTLTYFTLNYHVDSGTDSVYVWNGTLDSLQTITVNLSTIALGYGAHTFYVSVSDPNHGADENTANDSLHASFVIVRPVLVDSVLPEGFEGATFPPVGWSVTTPGSGVTWNRVTTGAYGLSAHSVAVDEFDPFFSTQGDADDLYTPLTDLSADTGTIYLSFDVAYVRYDSATFDSLVVLTTTDCGTTWNRIYANGGATLATAPDNTSKFIPTAGQWRRDSINISNLAGQQSVGFDFQLISGWGNVTYIDNINIAAPNGGTVGVKNIDSDVSLQVFPNPFSDNIMARFDLNEAANVDANLYSMDGKLVQHVLNGTSMGAGIHQMQIDTKQLSNGIYFLKMNQQVVKIEKVK